MATNGGNIVVPVGVQLELQNVQEIIANLQKAMSNVKPDTKGYSNIVSELSKAEKRADALASKLKQGFTTNAGIQSFTKGFEDLIAMVDTVNTKVGQINFDNLNLTADQQAQMETFVKNIQAAKDAYNSFEAGKIKEAVNASQTLQDIFSKLNLKVDTTSLDTAIASMKTKIAELQKQIDAEEKKVVSNETRAANRQSEIDELNRLKKIFTSQDLGKSFPEFFKTDGNFKSGGKQAFTDLLEKLGLDNNTIELVKKTAGSKIKEIQDELEKAINTRIRTKEGQRNTASDNAKAARDIADQLTAQQKEMVDAEKAMNGIKNDSSIVNARKQETDAIAGENAKIREFIELIQKAFGGNLEKNSNDLKTALDNVRASSGAAAAELANLEQRSRTVDSIKRSVSMWMGFNQVLRLSRTAIRNIIKDIRDLDKIMTQIAVVTNMTQSDLWNQMNTYQNMAKQYGVATTGVYQVSQIYYQQGLQTSEVMNLTNETLKMAKIAGLDYSKAADYMTVAIRGFKMEMSDAQNVVDVYSNLAAKSATNTTELATAMSKTASSAAAVGSSFENTSAMIAMMVETTRESAENIGSALKSIISRYGEMTSDPSKLVDSEGEALSLNKVDKALQSVGISLQDANHQFRDFDDVILELSSKWDTLDKNSQRYIATIMAGNRQQSRFLALVSDYDRLSELSEEAANAEDAALVQTLKTMDSLETKIQNVKNAFQSFYANLGLESIFKGALDVITNIINRLNTMPKIFGKIPAAAIGMVANIINVIKTLGSTLITVTTAKWQQISEIIKENIAKGFKEGTDEGTQYAENGGSKVGSQYNKKRVGIAAAGRALSMAGTAASTYALTIGDNEAVRRGKWEIGGGIATGIGQGIATGAMVGGPWGAALGGITGVVSALPSLVAGINDVTHAEELRIKAMRESTEKSNQEAVLAKSEARNLENTIEKIEKLSAAKNESNEAYQEWLDYINQIASDYPELISMYDSEGNAVINMAEAYEKLAQSRTKAAQASLDAQIDSLKTQQAEIKRMQKIANESIAPDNAGDKLGKGLSNVSGAFVDEKGNLNIGLNSNEIIGIAKDYLTDIFEEISTYGEDQGRVSQFKLKASGINAVQNWTAEDFGGSEENLEIARNAMADLFYEQFIKPLAKEGYLSDLHFENEEDIQKLVEGWDPEDIVQKYLDIMSQINETVQSNAELEEKVGELEEKKRSADLALQKWAEGNISAIDSFSKEKVSKFSGDSFMQTILEKNMPEKYITDTGFNAEGQNIINDLFNFYNQIDEDTYKEITSILAHPENYTSKLDLRAALAQTLGNDKLTEKLIEYITKTGEDGTSYLEDIWEKQVRSLQNKFQSNLSSSKQNKNPEIQKSIDNLLDIGDGSSSNGEIAAQYLNDINKQWTDLVTKQKNEAVATQNAEFLADTYLNVSELSEEVNGAMANILSTAELNTREGIQNAIDQIEQYQATNEVSSDDTAKLESILANLRQHKADLLLNLNTEIQSYVDSLSDAIENIGKNYSNNVSGFSKLSDANEVLQKINNEKIKTGEEQLNFNDVFTFDKTLGKYVFTIKGLIEANNQVIKDLDSQYEDTIDQLNQEKDIFSEITSENGLGSDIQKNKGDKTKVINALKKVSKKDNYSKEQQSYLEDLATRYEQSGKEWDVFIESEQKRLDQLGINIDQAHEAMLKMTVEAQQREAFKAIDFSAIANGSQSFEEAEQSFLNYYATQINQDLPEWLQNIQINLAKVTSKVAFNAIKMGGQGGLNMYRLLAAVTGQETDKNTENEIYNARVKAISSLHNKMQKATGQERIQLDDAERTVLGVTSRDIGATKLAEEYSKLIDEVRKGVKNGQTDIETANAAIIDEEFSDKLSLDKQTSALASIGTSKITPESIKTLANTIGVLKDLPDDFDIKQLKGLNKEGFITNIDEFLNSFNDLLVNKLTDSELDNIASSLELADKSKITDAAVQAENSIIESIASEINNLKSAGIDKKINLTYLTNKLGSDSLRDIFGDAYSDGILIVNEAVKANMYNSLNEVRSALKAKGANTDDLTEIIISYMDAAISDFNDFSGAFDVSDETAQLLVSKSSIFKNQLITTGKIAIHSAESFAMAANVIYNEVNSQYQRGLANLTKLNSSYANVVKSNLAKQTAGFSMLTSASKIDLTSLQNFLNIYNKKLSDYVDKMGNLTTTGATAGLKSLGNGNYQIADWHKFISQLQITANELSTEYIDAYVAWLESDANVAPNAKEALMTSLIPNMDKLTYAQIGQIAKTFNKTVDYVLALVENNGDNTFNGNALINSLDFDKTNKDFQKALINQQQTIANNLTSAMVSYVESGSDGFISSYDTFALDTAIDDYIKGMQALGEKVEGDKEKIKEILQGGGQNAVILGQKIASYSQQDLSSQDIETLYNGSISPYLNALEKVIAKPGEIVDKITADIINASSGEATLLTSGEYVVQSVADLYTAYGLILDKLRESGTATLEQINQTAALKIENRKVGDSKASEQYIIDALGDAANMTYTRFGEILATAGYELTEELVNSWNKLGIIKDYGSKLAITDFSQFADIMGWEAGSEEYISAFKSYNDAMIQMNRQVERNILEEAQSVAGAKGGDWINLTQLADKLQETIAIGDYEPDGRVKTSLKSLNDKLAQYGANIEDGILKIEPNADIPAIMQAVAQAAAESGSLLSNEMAQLADTVADAIKSYADLISGGIEGSLNNEQAERLQDWANKNGVGELNFTQTADGLKVATDQAFKLVNALKQVDSTQGKLTFDNLVKALSNDKGGKFENISKTTAEIAKAQREIAENNQKIDLLQKDGADINAKDIQVLREKNAQLREQISLYRDIQQAQSVDPSQYNFMDRDLPEVMQGPINYWNSVGKAFAAMNESSKTGKMAIQDFYNIVNEMNNLMAISGEQIELAGVKLDGSAEAAAALIQKGMGSLTNIDGKGVKVNLEGLGIDFASGANSAKSNFADGVHALAESQIAMLDAAIKVLEVIVAMESLGDISVDDNPEFSFGDVFDLGTPPEIDEQGNKWYKFTEEFNTWRENIVSMLTEGSDNYNADLAAAAESIKVNGVSLKNMLEAGANEIKDLGITQQEYFDILKAFQTAAASGDYDLDNIQESVWEVLKNSGLTSDLQIDVGDYTLTVSGGTKTLIDWREPNTQEAVAMAEKKYGLEEEEAKARLKEAFRKFEQGENTDSIETLLVLHAKNKIELVFDKDGNNPKIKIGDKEIPASSVEGQEIIAKAALESKGIKEEDIFGEKIDYSKEGNPVTISAHTKIGEAEVIVEADGEGNVIYRDTKYGLTANSLEELEQKMVEKYIAQNSSDENGAPTELQARQALFGMTVKPRVEVKTELDTPQLKQQAVKVAQMSTDKLKDLIEEENNDYEILEPTKKGYVRFNLGGIEVEVEDTGDLEANLAAAQEKVAGLVEDIDLVGKISEGIKDAFTNDNSIGEAISSGIAAALSNYTITIDPTTGKIEVKPIDGAVGEAVENEPLSPVQKLIDLIAKLTGKNTTAEGADEAAEEAVDKIDIKVPSADATITKLNITDVTDASMGGGGLVGQAISSLLGNKTFNIPSADATVTQLNIKSVSGAIVDSTATSGVTPPTIPSMDGTVTTLNINSVGSATVNSAAAEGAAEGATVPTVDSLDGKVTNLNIKEVGSANVDSGATESAAKKTDAPTINSMDGKVTTLNISEVGSGKYTAGEDAAAPTIPTLNATVTSLKVDATNVDVTSAAEAIAKALQEALSGKPVTPTVNAPESSGDNTNIGDGGLSGLTKAVSELADAASNASGPLGDAKTALSDVNSESLVEASKATTDAKSAELVNASKATTDAKSAEMSTASKAISDTQATKVVTATGAINNINTTPATNARTAINGISSIGASKAKEAINSIDSGPARNAKSALNNISVDLPISKETDVTLKYKVSKADAAGNIGGFAKVKGNGPAKVGGSTKTLMGELGPELVVSNGRYFIAGANGAEFVDLADDAIVFNHLQTRRLMSQGAIGGRGRPTTNEREAVAFAKGKMPSFGPAHPNEGDNQDSKQEAQEKRESEKISSVSVSPKSKTWHNLVRFSSRAKGTGPAMASASEALAALKQLRAMWQSLLNASLADMGGMPGGSGGGGGGGGGNEDTAKEVESVLKNIERWYNWLQLIEKTQNDINKITKEYDLLVAKGASSRELANKLAEKSKKLQYNMQTRTALVNQQKEFRKKREEEMNKTGFSAFYQAKDGVITLSNDEIFQNYVKKNGNNDLRANNIQTQKTVEIKTGNEAAELNKKNKSWNEKHKDDIDNGKLTAKKTDYKVGDTYQVKDKKVKTKQIKTGLELMNELQKKDEYGNNVYDAVSQYEILKQLGFEDYISTQTNGKKIDTSTEEGKRKAVENFYSRVEGDKEELEALNKSIQEQQEAALEDQKAIQEINNQYKEMAKPIEAVTDHLEEWYEWTRKIATVQSKLNILTKQYQALTYRTRDNTKEQISNLKKQIEQTLSLRDSTQKTIDEMTTKRQDMKNKINKNSGLNMWLKYDDTGNLVYDNKKNLKEVIKNNGGTSRFKITSYKEKISKKDGSYLRNVQVGKKTFEMDKTARDKVFTDLGLNVVNDSAAFSNLQDKYSKWSEIPKGYTSLYTKVGNEFVLGKEGQTEKQRKKFANDIHTAQAKVSGYDNGVNIFDTVTTTAKSNTSLGKKLKDLQNSLSNPEDFFNKLTATDKNGNAVFDGRQQMEILQQMGLGDEMAKMAQLESWNTATEEEKIEAAKKYLETVKQIPEEYNKLLDSINENKEKLQEYKNQVMEINNQIKELLKPINGVTERLEAWYKWTRQITDAQNRLNILTAKYSNLQKRLGDNTSDQVKNLKSQASQVKKQINANKEEQKERKTNYINERNKVLKGSMKQFFTTDENGSIVYNTNALTDAKGKKLNRNKKFSYEVLVNEEVETKNFGKYKSGKNKGKDKNLTFEQFRNSKSKERYKKGWDELSSKQKNEIKDEIQNEWDLATVATTTKTNTFKNFFGKAMNGGLTPEEFINELTKTDNNGKAVHSLQEQRAVLEAAGLQDQMAKIYGQGNWEDLSAEQRNEAAETYLKTISETPDKVNELKDALKAAEAEEIELKGQILEINNQIRELLKPIDGVTEHLESWYKWTRQTADAQNVLNELAARYSNLQKQLGDSTSKQAENLKDQAVQIQKQIKANKKEQKERAKNLEEEQKKVTEGPLQKFLSVDPNTGSVTYSTKKLKGLTKNSKASYEEILTDNKGNEKRDVTNSKGNAAKMTWEEFKADQGYIKNATSQEDKDKNEAIQTAWDLSMVATSKKDFKLSSIFTASEFEAGITPEQFINRLTETGKNNKAKLSLQQQRAALEAAGLQDQMADLYGQGGWSDLTADQRNEAAKNYLDTISQYPDKMNELNDALKAAEVKGINLEGQILDINQQLKELTTIAAGIQNPFEQWHSWLQKIKQEQNSLNILTKQYSNLEKERVNNGSQIASNLRSQLDNLKQQQATNQSYLKEREKDYNNLINTSNWTNAQKKFFEVDKNGQLQYNDANFKKQIQNRNGIELTGGTDKNGVYNYRNISETINFSATGIEDFLNKLTEQSADNSMKYNADQQFEILKAFGFSDLMQFDSSGNPIFQYGIENATKEEREAAVKTVLDNLKGFQDKVESSADDLQELREKGIELTGNVIDIKNQIQDNEIELENKILQAIEDREQKRIDDLKEQKDMLSETADNFLNGLSEQLDKEKKMYEKQESQDELTKLQRQLAILQRSGGSSSQIRSLQEQIKSQQKDMYFDERQDQIDAIKEASDKQIEKLDRQIQIAEETLAFNKENGLYWKEVRDIMKLDSDQILSFIETNLAERKEQSSLQGELAIAEDGKIVGTYIGTKTMAFKTGGLADYTGPAWLDGTKKKPESVLNADQTDFLRNKLIDNLESFSLAINQFTKGTLSNNLLNELGENSGINIEQLDFVMKVDSIANDYDAKRAGQQAFDEMIRIARKTGNRSVSRR